MESRSLKLPEIPSSEQTPLVQRLLQLILEQQKRIEQLEEEVQRLKGVTVKPKIKPSRLEQGRTSQEEAGEKAYETWPEEEQDPNAGDSSHGDSQGRRGTC